VREVITCAVASCCICASFPLPQATTKASAYSMAFEGSLPSSWPPMVSVCSDSPAALELAAAVGEVLASGAEACGGELSSEADCVGLEGSSLALPAVVLPQPASARHPNRTVSEPSFT